MTDEDDLRAVHEVLEGAFTDHFNSKPGDLRRVPAPAARGPRPPLGPLVAGRAGRGRGPQPVGALVGTVSESRAARTGRTSPTSASSRPARGRGVAKGLLRTVIADAAARGRDRVGLEVDADSPDRRGRPLPSMGWETTYVTESWHRDVPVG